MTTEGKVWIAKRKTRKGVTYHLRWICPQEKCWLSRKVDGDFKRATYEAAKLQEKLEEGTYRSVRRMSWSDFTDDHVKKIIGKANRAEAERVLKEFGTVCNPCGPHGVTFSMIEAYKAHLCDLGNSTATRNKKMRYIRSAMNLAIEREYAVRNPLINKGNSRRQSRLFDPEEERAPRVVTDEEERTLLKHAKAIGGFRLWAFVRVAIHTGARRAELTGLRWANIDLDGDVPRIHLADTKSHRDRFIPINREVTLVLRRLQMQTLIDGGPFKALADNLGRVWGRVRDKAGLQDVSVHDLRRTFVTRHIRKGTPMPHVQRLAGHAKIDTTLRYYNWVSDDDLIVAQTGAAKVAG